MAKGAVIAHTLVLLEGLNYPSAGYRSKAGDELSRARNPDAPELDFVFTVCDDAAGETCPFGPGQPMSAHRGVPGQAAVGR